MCKALLMKNEIILFTDGNINIEVQINPEQETVWLTQKYCLMLSILSHLLLAGLVQSEFNA